MHRPPPGSIESCVDALRSSLPPELLSASGRVLYVPPATLFAGSPIYFLGLNPAEDSASADLHAKLTVADDLDRLKRSAVVEHALLDEKWRNHQVGSAPIQLAARAVFALLCNGDASAGDALLRRTPVSNFILVRSSSEADLKRKYGTSADALVRLCWPFHDAVIRTTGCTVVLTHAVGAAGALARSIALPPPECRPSGWGGTLATLYAWRLNSQVRLLAMPNLSRYKPTGPRALALREFFREFGPRSDA